MHSPPDSPSPVSCPCRPQGAPVAPEPTQQWLGVCWGGWPRPQVLGAEAPTMGWRPRLQAVAPPAPDPAAAGGCRAGPSPGPGETREQPPMLGTPVTQCPGHGPLSHSFSNRPCSRSTLPASRCDHTLGPEVQKSQVGEEEPLPRSTPAPRLCWAGRGPLRHQGAPCPALPPSSPGQ